MLSVLVITTLSSSTSPPDSVIRSAIVLGTANFPVITARSWPCRTKSESLLLPRTNPSAVKTIVLPAPVSPVKTVKPGLNSIFVLSITPRPRMEISSKLLLLTFLLATPTLNRQLKFSNNPIGKGGWLNMCQQNIFLIAG